MENWTISVIVPAFDEEGTIGETLERLSRVQREFGNIEIIVVDDGSEDNTLKEVANFANVRYIKHCRNMGKGAALNTGIKESIGKVIVIQDADLEYFPEKIPELVAPILKEEVDVVYGTRLINGIPKGMSFSHYIGNRLLSLVTTIIYGVKLTDVMTGYKAFKRQIFDVIELESRGFGIEIELTIKSLYNGLKFKEIPLAYRYRLRGASKIRYKDGLRCLLQLVTGRFGSPYKSMGKISMCPACTMLQASQVTRPLHRPKNKAFKKQSVDS